MQELENALFNLEKERPKLKADAKKSDIYQVVQTKYPKILVDVSLALLALPPTQVSVERLFSALKILMSERRNKLKEDILKAMLFIRINKWIVCICKRSQLKHYLLHCTGHFWRPLKISYIFGTCFIHILLGHFLGSSKNSHDITFTIKKCPSLP